MSQQTLTSKPSLLGKKQKTPRTPKKHGDGLIALVFLTPVLLGYAIFYFWPMIRGIQISFTDWNLLSDPQWVGLANYRELMGDKVFGNALVVTIIYVLVNITSQTILGLGIAVLMQRISQSVVIRSLLLVPWLVPNVTVAVITLFILDPNVGLMNHILSYIAVNPISFYGNGDIAIYTIALVNSWRNMGYTALLLFAGMQTIPRMVTEAAIMDGASAWRQFRSITLPLLRPILVMVVVVSMIGSFQIFDTVSVATKGGPGNSTRVIYFYIYQKAFQQFDMGYAAAMAVVLLLILLVLSALQMKILRADSSDLD
ncbi:MAG: sugar ABC transporter permease [Actinomycetaceae bacterium]|nr:sugar ABC transporter permease [Actinomycetaceae bacterium]